MSKYTEEVIAQFRKKWGQFYYSDEIGMDWEKPEKQNVTGGIPNGHSGYCIASGDIEKDFLDALQKQIEMIEGEIESRRRTITLTQILDILNQYK